MIIFRCASTLQMQGARFVSAGNEREASLTLCPTTATTRITAHVLLQLLDIRVGPDTYFAGYPVDF